MKRLIPILVTLLLASTSFVGVSYNIEKSSPVSFDGKTLYVGGSGPGNYTNIQDAIDDASDGDTVFVYNGTYNENVIVGKSLNLFGENRNITFIDGNGSDDVIYISACNTTISGFTIQNSGNGSYFNAGIVIHSSYNIIKNNIISNNKECGVYCNMGERYGNNHIYNNVISNNRDFGIIIESAYYELNVNYVFCNHIENNTRGIYIKPDWYPDVSAVASYIYNNTVLRNEYGIVIDQGFGIQVFDNTITKNKCGIRLSGEWFRCFNNSIYGNEISENKNGIRIESGFMGGACRNNIYLNNITGNNRGIYIRSFFDSGFPNKNNISKNNFLDNKINAFFYCGWLFSNKNNIWIGNYWEKPREKPYIIFGAIDTFLLLIQIPWINIDWHPAQEPYNI